MQLHLKRIQRRLKLLLKLAAKEAKEAADKADQTIATKGWIWFDDADDSGYLTMYVADSISENVTAQDDGNGNLEVILS